MTESFFSTSPVLYLLGSFLPHPSSPARRGSTSPPKSSHPQEGGLKTWPAGPVLANKLSPLKGLLVVVKRNRIAIVLRNRIAIVLCTMCEGFTHDVRVLMRRGRGGARGRGVMGD